MTLYQRGSWTCPASHNTDDKTWDLAFLSKAEFMSKYGCTEEEYKDIASKGTK